MTLSIPKKYYYLFFTTFIFHSLKMYLNKFPLRTKYARKKLKNTWVNPKCTSRKTNSMTRPIFTHVRDTCKMYVIHVCDVNCTLLRRILWLNFLCIVHVCIFCTCQAYKLRCTSSATNTSACISRTFERLLRSMYAADVQYTSIV